MDGVDPMARRAVGGVAEGPADGAGGEETGETGGFGVGRGGEACLEGVDAVLGGRAAAGRGVEGLADASARRRDGGGVAPKGEVAGADEVNEGGVEGEGGNGDFREDDFGTFAVAAGGIARFGLVDADGVVAVVLGAAAFGVVVLGAVDLGGADLGAAAGRVATGGEEGAAFPGVDCVTGRAETFFERAGMVGGAVTNGSGPLWVEAGPGCRTPGRR